MPRQTWSSEFENAAREVQKHRLPWAEDLPKSLGVRGKRPRGHARSLADIATAALHAGLVRGVISAGPETREDGEDGPHGRVGCLFAALVTAVAYAKFASGGDFLSLVGAAICLVSISFCLVGLFFSRCARDWCGGRQGTGRLHPASKSPTRHAANAAPRIFDIDAARNPLPRPVSQVGAGVPRSPSSTLGPRPSGASPSGRHGRKWGAQR
jgi:hypothetical protein